MSGVVEMDETYVGGRRRGTMPGRSNIHTVDHKTPVFGMAERGGRVRAKMVPDARRETLTNAIGDDVSPDAILMTDEWPAYRVIAREYRDHYTINHRNKVYVQGSSTRTPSSRSGRWSGTPFAASTTALVVSTCSATSMSTLSAGTLAILDDRSLCSLRWLLVLNRSANPAEIPQELIPANRLILGVRYSVRGVRFSRRPLFFLFASGFVAILH